MTQTIRYFFGRNDEDEYEFEVNVKDYIGNLNSDELIELAKFIFNDVADDEDREIYRQNYPDLKDLPNGDISNDDYILFVKDIVADFSDEDEVFDYLEGDMKLFYESEAYEEYLDAEAYSADPLGYYGMSIHDFIG